MRHNSNRNRRRSLTIAALTTAAVGMIAATALAISTTSSGGAQISMQNATETAPSNTSSTAWVPASQMISVTASGHGTLINARFTAESKCTGKVGICRVRIVALGPGGIVELDPADGANFAFDSATGSSNDLGEGHAIERSHRLTEGAWHLIVQYSVSDPGTSFTISDTHFAVEASA